MALAAPLMLTPIIAEVPATLTAFMPVCTTSFTPSLSRSTVAPTSCASGIPLRFASRPVFSVEK